MNDAPDYRSDPSESPEGRGIAYGRLAAFWDSMPDNVRAEASREATIASIDDHPAFIREQVNDDRQPIEISSTGGDAVLMSRADYLALEETAHLLRAPTNARRLLESLEHTRRCP